MQHNLTSFPIPLRVSFGLPWIPWLLGFLLCFAPARTAFSAVCDFDDRVVAKTVLVVVDVAFVVAVVCY